MIKVLTIVGTRPEVIKMAPVIKELSQYPGIESFLCLTGQHDEMVRPVLDLFHIAPDRNLRIMRPGQSLEDITGSVLRELMPLLVDERPDVVLVHGDTTSAMAAALAAFYKHIPVGHVEAGLRTGNLESPWPEELNRRVIDASAHFLFAPTEGAQRNLIAENLGDRHIILTGNTVVDALEYVLRRLDRDPSVSSSLAHEFKFLNPSRRLILVTCHRRESFGDGFSRICAALAKIAERSDVELVYPVHLNPNVQEPVRRLLGGKSNIHLIRPCGYLEFVYLMQRSHIILTDSGGIQEEAPTVGRPVVVMRERTERQEAVDAGVVRIAGTNTERIVEAVCRLLDDPADYSSAQTAVNPYGDGKASQRIVGAIADAVAS